MLQKRGAEVVRVPNIVLLLISGQLPGPHLYTCSALTTVEGRWRGLELSPSEKPVSSLSG